MRSNRTRPIGTIVVTCLPFLTENVEMNKQMIRFLPVRSQVEAELRACFEDKVKTRIAAVLQLWLMPLD